MNSDKTLNVTEYLARHETKDLLRLLTCGSVDDGKSTLIGRLLYDTHLIYEDQLAALERDSKVHGTTGDDFDPALLLDGLKAEREQGITIDVAYRYFSTDRRKFIIADCPGHEQYTRNMATGASNCNLAILLVDARQGVLTQTRRHSFICSLLGIRHAVVAINKMDLVGWSAETYEKIRDDFLAFSARLGFTDVHFIPVSALGGDNVAAAGGNMPWYDGPTLLHHLENVNITADRNLVDMRLPVQYVIRPHLDYRGFSGTMASGVLRKGDRIIALPSRQRSRVRSIEVGATAVDEAFPPMSAAVTLEDEIDVSRGSMLVHPHNVPHSGDAFEAMLVWMDDAEGMEGRSFLLKHTTQTVPAVLADIRYKIDVNTMRKMQAAAPGESAAAAGGDRRGAPGNDEPSPGATILTLNDIARVHLTLHRPISFDPYERNRQTGGFILIDRVTNLTVACGMIIERLVADDADAPGAAGVRSRNISREKSLVSDAERRGLLGQRGSVLWLTGLSGAGKSTIARALEKRLMDAGRPCFILDGDNVRRGLNRDLGFSAEDRSENIRRVAEVAGLFADAGMLAITAFISPYRRDRDEARRIIDAGAGRRFFEIHLAADLETCERRDPKGLYKKARAGEIRQFTGISAPYEEPQAAELVIDTAGATIDQAVDRIVRLLQDRKIIDGKEREEI